ncbi:MAG: aconitase X catalytic domain-containing protein [Chloroflexota bacterium]|nr:aconitase X catalytic domain-containing protein [Chloroflexota bacterium]
MNLLLEDRDREMLGGMGGEATALAMRIVVAMAEAAGAARLLDITGAHIDGCLYHGPVGLRFAERLAADGARVRVPTTLNVSAVDLLHPASVRLAEPMRSEARRQMTAYESMGCQPTWTCAPYQLPHRPAFGEHVCWAESNAIVFANSVLGARTDRYGDFMDICAAITGRVPEAGLHLDANRLGRVVFRLSGFGEVASGHEAFWALLGNVVGARAGNDVPVVLGAPEGVPEDHLKALGAAAASSGSVALVHVVGTTPEAATLNDALGGRPPLRTIDVGPDDLRAAVGELTGSDVGGPLRAVSVGTPHLSLEGFERLTPMLAATRIHSGVTFYVSTGRDVLRRVEERGWLPVFQAPGIRLVVDTCTYIAPILGPDETLAMTDSAKWAWYAPGNLGITTAFGTMEDCVRSAAAGRVIRDFGWLDG